MQDDSNFRAKDIKRIENTTVHLTKLQNKISKCKAEITKQRNLLFNIDHVMKPWKANELNFYDVCLKQLGEKASQIAIVIGKLQSLAGRLRQKFFRIDIEGSEKARAAKRKQENAAKAKKEKESRLRSKAVEVIKILAPKRTIDEEKVMRNIKELGSFNVADDIKDSNQLLPRFHLKTLSYLIEQGIFVENAKTKAIAIRDRLEREMEKTKEGNLKKKETKKKNSGT